MYSHPRRTDRPQTNSIDNSPGQQMNVEHIRPAAKPRFLYGPKPGLPGRPVVIVLDNGPIHTSKATLAALAARAHWLTVEWLPKYAPQLTDIEVVWHDLKAIISRIRPSPTSKPSTRPSTRPSCY